MGNETGKFDLKSFMQFIEKTPFYGTPFKFTLSDGYDYEMRLIKYIAPAIVEYFRNLDILSSAKMDHLDWTLCIESMVLKFEPMLRFLLQARGGITAKQTRKENKVIEEEKNINDIFHDNIIKETLNEEDYRFLKYLLIEKGGENLRHEIAHGLLLPENYTFEIATFLLLGILRLAKYTLPPPTIRTEETSQ